MEFGVDIHWPQRMNLAFSLSPTRRSFFVCLIISAFTEWIVEKVRNYYRQAWSPVELFQQECLHTWQPHAALQQIGHARILPHRTAQNLINQQPPSMDNNVTSRPPVQDPKNPFKTYSTLLELLPSATVCTPKPFPFWTLNWRQQHSTRHRFNAAITYSILTAYWQCGLKGDEWV